MDCASDIYIYETYMRNERPQRGAYEYQVSITTHVKRGIHAPNKERTYRQAHFRKIIFALLPAAGDEEIIGP